MEWEQQPAFIPLKSWRFEILKVCSLCRWATFKWNGCVETSPPGGNWCWLPSKKTQLSIEHARPFSVGWQSGFAMGMPCSRPICYHLLKMWQSILQVGWIKVWSSVTWLFWVELLLLRFRAVHAFWIDSCKWKSDWMSQSEEILFAPKIDYLSWAL